MAHTAKLLPAAQPRRGNPDPLVLHSLGPEESVRVDIPQVPRVMQQTALFPKVSH